MVTVGDDPLLGLVVEGRYKIESVIGQGSAGTVYRAVQELIGREVAIKVLHDYLVSDQEFIKRFTQEAKASSRLSHPNIITIYDFGVIPKGGRPYIAMDLLRGTPLSDVITERNHIEVEEAIPIFKQVSSALAEAHRQGVVHRDIKPENIVLVERSGQKYFPIVVDFGIARLVQEESDVARITRTGTVCGSPTYMSPEQCTSSKVDHRSDIYSLGVVIYETLTGEVPFLSDELVKVMAMHLSDPPKPINQVRPDLQFPLTLEEIVYKCLAKSPDSRFQSMDELAEALDEALKEPEAPTGMPPGVVSLPPVLKRPEIVPGPLAQDDELASGRLKASKEMIAPKPKPMDLAARALEELKTSGAYSELDERVAQARIAAMARSQTQDMQSASVQSLSHANFSRGRLRGGAGAGAKFKFFGMRALLFIFVLGVLLAGGVAAMNMSGFDVSSLISHLPWRQVTQQDVDAMIKSNKMEDALNGLKALRQQQQGKLNKNQTEQYAKVSVSLAKQYARDKRYDDALKLLADVPKGTSVYDAAKQLTKRYQLIRGTD